MLRTLLHHSLERWAKSAPEHPAFRCRGESISYGEFFSRACQLANVLRKNGLKPLDRVGIHMGKSNEMAIAVYGILLAGGAYVPVDVSAPAQRVEFIINDCGIRILVTASEKIRTLKSLESKDYLPLQTVIGLERSSTSALSYISWNEVYRSTSDRPEEHTREDDLAYIMYTSGSTGTPKGLMHTHRSGLSYARYSADLYAVSQADILGNHAPLHFDISTFEFLVGPYAGATSVLIPEEDMMFPTSLARLIERERLTFWYSVPLALIQLFTRGELDGLNLTSLRWVKFGGEPFPPSYLRELMKRLPQARFCNVYGPAEVNQCTFYNLPEQLTSSDEAIPLGEIWQGANALILNTEDQRVEGAGSGELLIASSTMMQGYWARKDLDRKAFYFEEPVLGFSRRYYRTGDLVRRDEKGALHFIGRKDRQIKLRGYRIELDEIEAAFVRLPEIEEAAAIVRTDDDGEKTILAIVSTAPGFEVSLESSRKSVKATLPSYAVPSQVIITDSFPRTGSGKIDRTTLQNQYNERSVI
ncbi:amino acid adenylation domain-containing protein [Pelagicoccus sp. SDUM812002]|uniref:amino acid adenylation domain-containing protein n=1 Tax=Pelagicoccus sp. SDUM812002 TaxID=3041266 RepID=UPI0028106C3B|nr:amino acid adenylation domain-containing protein [Pelagicoccus sp. SDUM812002]MDQ8185697.1 amino acid adenylation domain-containing protein [Pelagicoccus sp. SDUM812002]